MKEMEVGKNYYAYPLDSIKLRFMCKLEELL